MTEQEAADRIAALERARAQIEIALSTNADWVAYRRAAAGSGRLVAERALAGNPLYKSWDLLNQAIEDLHARSVRQAEADPGMPPDDLTRIRGIGPALAQRLVTRGTTTFAQIAAWRPDDVRSIAEGLGFGRKVSRQNWIKQAALLDLRRRVGATETAQPVADASHVDDHARRAGRSAARSIELGDVLQSIRNDATLRSGELPSVVPDVGPQVAPTRGEAPAALRGHEQAPEPVDGTPARDGVQTVAFEPEEATVTFVIRDRPGLPGEHDLRRGPRPSNSVAPDDTLQAAAENLGAEAEVDIVRRQGQPK